MLSFSRDGRRRHKEQLYHLFARVASAMANAHRLELLDLLAQAPRTVEELAREAHMSVANTSQHLQRLKQARLVLDERDGPYVRYRLASPAVVRLWLELRAVAELQLTEVEQALGAYRERRNEFERIAAEAVRRRLQAGEIILLDVRPQVEYEAGHLLEAISIHLDDLKRRLNELPQDKTVVAYCRGPYCAYADDALALLAKKGWNVARLEEGVVEWQEGSYPVE